MLPKIQDCTLSGLIQEVSAYQVACAMYGVFSHTTPRLLFLEIKQHLPWRTNRQWCPPRLAQDTALKYEADRSCSLIVEIYQPQVTIPSHT